ncbi:unnamed protein product [Rotaria socialis]|uniref:ADP ribosyltransferase domain-containing protein n=1 Tax=Rotaria socialis TaxID=392032 RepID=A0A817QNP4_9BILA|nr:unnamed protein product [Rotaria socialis]CAF3494540.1 unnamed protein product [Rotaria socialis]CAF4355819.1 unnamed protein product [Rotaria socialis]CAF4485299.1 unnamed protein product [Rotaria socialis]
MATAEHDDNLETFSLLWLDAEANATEENKRAKQRLRSIINHLKIFHDLHKCKNGRLGKELVPQIHDLHQLSSVYIYCKEKKFHKQWAQHFCKVKSVVVNLDDLIDRIKRDQKIRVKHDQPMIMNIYDNSRNPDESTTELNGNFIHYLLLIDVLIRMKFNEKDNKKFIEFCKDKFSGNDLQLSLIQEFERDYKPNDAIWWYTRDGFLFNMLNKALRIQNTELLFLFRFFIHDLYQQLKKNQCETPVQVYRCQTISVEELRNLQRSRDQIISINSFFSTTSNRSVALKFSSGSKIAKGLNQVLFTIEVDPHKVKSKPFADISTLSYFNEESEVLFMVGCIFRLMNIRWDDNDKLWIIQMQLAGNEKNDVKDLFHHLREEYGGGESEADLLSYGDILCHMGKYDLAEKIYSDLRKRCSTDDDSYDHLCFSLAVAHKERKDFARSLRWFQRALDRKMRTDPSDLLYIAGLHCSIGNIHMEKKQYDEAMKYYNKAMELYKRENATNHANMASLYYGIARIFYFQNQYADALNYHQESLNIQQKHLPNNHPDMAINYTGMGDIYLSLHEYQHATEYYRRSLDIRKKSLPPQHPNIALSNQNIGKVYEATNQQKDALEYYQKALIIYRHSLAADHPDVIDIKKDIERVIAKRK